MVDFGCGADAGGHWCRQQAARERLSVTRPTDAESRQRTIPPLEELKAELKALSKDPKLLADERRAIHARFCALPEKKSYLMCETKETYSYDSDM